MPKFTEKVYAEGFLNQGDAGKNGISFEGFDGVSEGLAMRFFAAGSEYMRGWKTSPSKSAPTFMQFLSNVAVEFAGSVVISGTLVAPGIDVNEDLQTTDGSAHTISTIGLLANSVYRIKASIIGRQSDGSNRAFFEEDVIVYRNGGSAAIESSENSSGEPTPGDDSSWAVSVQASGNNILFKVVGAGSTTIDWNIRYSLQRVS